MDPVTLGAVLLAVVTGISETLSGQLWAGVVSLVRRPLRRKAGAGGDIAAVSSGEAELTALQQAPGDQRRAVALAEVLLARAGADAEFAQALRDWWDQAGPVQASIGNAVNTISGGTQQGPVLQGRDFSNITFGATPAAPPSSGSDADATTVRIKNQFADESRQISSTVYIENLTRHERQDRSLFATSLESGSGARLVVGNIPGALANRIKTTNDAKVQTAFRTFGRLVWPVGLNLSVRMGLCMLSCGWRAVCGMTCSAWPLSPGISGGTRRSSPLAWFFAVSA